MREQKGSPSRLRQEHHCLYPDVYYPKARHAHRPDCPRPYANVSRVRRCGSVSSGNLPCLCDEAGTTRRRGGEMKQTPCPSSSHRAGTAHRRRIQRREETRCRALSSCSHPYRTACRRRGVCICRPSSLRTCMAGPSTACACLRFLESSRAARKHLP